MKRIRLDLVPSAYACSGDSGEKFVKRTKSSSEEVHEVKTGVLEESHDFISQVCSTSERTNLKTCDVVLHQCD